MKVQVMLVSSFYHEAKVHIINYVSEELVSKSTYNLMVTKHADCISVKLIWKWK